MGENTETQVADAAHGSTLDPQLQGDLDVQAHNVAPIHAIADKHNRSIGICCGAIGVRNGRIEGDFQHTRQLDVGCADRNRLMDFLKLEIGHIAQYAHGRVLLERGLRNAAA